MTRLMIADDAPFIREIVRTVVERNQDSLPMSLVAEAVDGQDAIAQALTAKPDVILMDIIMPVKSGIEATREILGSLPSARIIAFSTADQDIMVMRAMEAGCCSYLVKPFRADELLQAIRDAIDPDKK